MKSGDRLGDTHLQGIGPENFAGLVHPADDVGQDLGDVGTKSVVEIIHAGERPELPVGQLDRFRTEHTALVDQNILNDADGRAQADAASGTGESPDQFQQQIEMLGQERVESHKCLVIRVAFEQASSR